MTPPLRLLTLAALAAIAAAGAGAAVCEDRAIRVDIYNRGAEARIFVTVRDGMDVTITITAVLANLLSSEDLPHTIDLSGQKEAEILSLRRADGANIGDIKYHLNWQPGGRGGQHDPNAIYRLPYDPAQPHRLTQGNLGKFSHAAGSGMDYAFDFTMPEGTPVLAAREGVVAGVRVDSKSGGPKRQYNGCTNYVIIRHPDGTYGEYLHLQQKGALVKVGAHVTAGQPIALSGNTGFSSAPHLHFCVFRTLDGRKRETIPIRFTNNDGKILPMHEGEAY